VLTSDGSGSIAVDVSVSEDDESMPPTSSRPENFPAEHELHTEGELLPPNVEFLQNVTIVPVPSKPSTTTSEFRPLSHGMEAIYELVVTEKTSLEGAIESDELKESVTKYLEIYFKNFHVRWPILHAPTFDMDIDTIPLSLSASVCVIGAWLQHNANWTERFYTLRVHDILLQRLLRSLVCIFILIPGGASIDPSID
jgi:Fungal specific transcription factor domain